MASPAILKAIASIIGGAGLWATTRGVQASQGLESATERGQRWADVNYRWQSRRVRRAVGADRPIDAERAEYRREMYRQLGDNLQELAPEVKAVTETFGEMRKGVTDVSKAGIPGLLSGFLRVTSAADRTSMALLEAQAVLGEYSAAHAMALAELEVGRIQRSMEMGRATGPSFQYLARSRSRLEQSLLPFRQAGQIVSNRIIGTVTNVLARVINLIERLEPITEWIERVLGGSGDDRGDGTAEPFMDLLGEGLGVSESNRRPRRV